jgi:hypothetical protein
MKAFINCMARLVPLLAVVFISTSHVAAQYTDSLFSSNVIKDPRLDALTKKQAQISCVLFPN